MEFRMSLLLLSLAVVMASGQKRHQAKAEWNYRDGSDKVSMRGVANLTQVLDDWRFDILSQMKGQLQNDHQTLLPDYSRIQPLSEALNDLYKEFNALKAHLGDLTEKFGPIETFIDELKAKRATAAAAGASVGARAGAAAAPPRGRRPVRNKPPPS
uniref:Si:ch211-76l23.4 n=1 Tax=Astyanax mexicanus TaxID=7994 RepID=A0A3B1JAV4_ASTMX